MTDTVLSLHQVTQRYGKLTALDAVDLAIPAGAIYGFLGPNGAGKTTAIRCAMGLLRPQAGRIEIGGHDLTRNRRQALASVGAVIETPALFPNLTGRENLDVTRRMLGIAPALIDRALELVDMREAADRRVGQYSLGMKQRMGLARALLAEPKLLILDEPTNGLDPAGIRDMRSLIRALPERTGATIFMSSHLLSEIEQLATHVGLLQHGRVLFDGTLDALSRQQTPRLIITAAPVAQAEQVLRSAGFADPIHEGERLILTDPGAITPERAASFNAALHEAGCRVSELRLERADLETTFMTLTGHTGDAA
ncbi:ABC transporter ATP-binding protein [Maricaulis maris]|uniref:ABC-2 type transport system ATP-binding protein n=1 Tax=Maricaulis maris TaxID=74318 RepID=A0A495DKT5_9PROT|nr:ABC transporter ATP-binding protein [Maricaulis maris]RKR03230.1 ABC-2 type transport system ATP-binding protein [Maricaulis maris]